MPSKTPILVTCAWPYANGSLHIGHISALLPADILVRYFKQTGHPVLFVSGTDAHGTPISIKADQEGVNPQSIADAYHHEFVDTFSKLDFSFAQNGIYSVTTSPFHAAFVQSVFIRLLEKGYLEEREETGLWSKKDNRFLPDRYIEGECPHCSYDPARGDQCDNCGNLLDPLQLKNRRSTISGDTPIEKKTKHFYFLLSKLESKLKEYLHSLTYLRQNTKDFTLHYITSGLRDRAITRDIDWGIKVPVEGYESKRIYVWFEAVCGYLSASQEWASKKGDQNAWKPFWHNAHSWYVYGKDNIPFHTLIWPAILLAFDDTLTLPEFHVSSEYVQIERKKLSTSRNWAIWMPNVLQDFSSDEIRYGLIALAPETSDSNFSFNEFRSRFNNEFIATLGNFIQRTLKLSVQAGVRTIPAEPGGSSDVYADVAGCITTAKFRAGMQEILRYAAQGNKYIDTHAPWKLLSSNKTQAVNLLRHAIRHASQFGIILEPFLPKAAKTIKQIFGIIDDQPFSYYTKQIIIDNPPEKIFNPITDDAIQHQQTYLTQA